MTQSRIAIIGAGIAGITAAYWAATRGHSVTVFDSNRDPAMGTSRANGGQLSACNAETWNQWSMIAKGFKWLLDPRAPLKIGLMPEPAKIAWLARFVYHTYQDTNQQRTSDTIRMALDSRKALDEIVQRERIEFDHQERGILHVYKNSNSWRDAQTRKNLFESNGCEWQTVEADGLSAIEPALSQSEWEGGILTPSDSTGDIHKFCVNLARRLTSRYDVKFVFDHSVNTLDTFGDSVLVDGDSFDHVIVACGTHSNRLARQMGDSLGIYPIKGYSITVDLSKSSQDHAPWTSLLDDDAKIVCSRLGAKRLRVAGTAELNGHNKDILQERIDPLLDWTASNFPGVSLRNYTPWAGLRPMTPDMMPVVRQSKGSSRVWYHTGHGHLGWTLSAGTARSLIDQMFGPLQ
jgi:D-amino-acid dehydrogenase